jgi:chromate transporter
MKKFIRLFLEFFRLGFITFGGGIAMLPSMKAIALKHRWIALKDWEEIVTLSQLAPGAIAINCANLIGYRAQGKLGSFMAVSGMMLPPIIVITLVALGLQDWLLQPLVLNALKGMFLVVIVLFANALISLGKLAWQSWWLVGVSILSFLLTYFDVLSPVWMIVLGVCVFLLLSLVRKTIR